MDELIKQISANGPFGLLAALSLAANVQMFRLLLAEKDKRVDDATTFVQTSQSTFSQIKDSLSFIEKYLRITKNGDN